jgi:hypothetical protein
MGRTSKEVGVMPRDTIVNAESIQHKAHPGDEDRPPSEEHVEQKLGLSLGWNKIGWVQIHMFPAEWDSTGDWHIVDLDRSQINHLIRSLRKVRDQAYGSDA